MSLIAPNAEQFRTRPLRCVSSCCNGRVTFTSVSAYTAHLRARSHVRLLVDVPPRRPEVASPRPPGVEAKGVARQAGAARGSHSPKGCA